MMKLSIVSILILLIIVPLALANSVYENWGFSGYTKGGSYSPPYPLWSSSVSSQGTIPSTMVNSTFNNYRLPIVTSLKSDILLSKPNEVYLFSNTALAIYDSSFSQIGIYNLNGWNGGNVAVVTLTGSSTPHLAYLSKTGTDYNLKLLNRTGSSFSIFKSINVSDNQNYTGSVKAGLIDYAYIYTGDYNITRINLVTGAETTYNKFRDNITKCAVEYTPTFGNDVEVFDYNNDGFDDVLVIGQEQGTVNKQLDIGILNTNTGLWDMQIAPYGGKLTTVSCSVASAQIGSTSSVRKIIIFWRGTVDTTIVVFDLAGNQLYASTGGGEKQYSYPLVADINLDALNEFIDKDISGNLLVYDSSFTKIGTIQYPTKQIARFDTNQDMNIIGIGKYLFNSTFFVDTPTSSNVIAGYLLDIISPFGIMQIQKPLNASGTVPAYPVYNFPAPNALSFALLPVSIQNQNTKDILLLSDATYPSMAFFSNIAGSVCGNGMCETGESALSCPADCAPTQPEASVITSVEINPCNTQVWKQNTTVQVTVIAQNINNENSNVYVIFAPGSTLGGCTQSANQTNVASGSLLTFNFIANCSGSANIIVETNTNSIPELNSLSFPFSVSPTNGAVFGDSSCGITQPLSAVLPIGNTTTNQQDNGLTNAMKDFVALTHLGLNVLTFFILIVVTIGILVLGIQAGFPANLISGIILLVDAFIVLIAVNLGWINIGIVITLAIVGLIVIGLWISKQLQPNS
jgi:hypothetical protein